MGVAIAACTTYSENKTTLEPTAEPTTIHRASTLAPDATPAESPTAVPIQLRMTGFVVDATERSATEIELL